MNEAITTARVATVTDLMKTINERRPVAIMREQLNSQMNKANALSDTLENARFSVIELRKLRVELDVSITQAERHALEIEQTLLATRRDISNLECAVISNGL